MKIYLEILVTVIACVFAVSCMPAATDAELEQMCDNLVRLRGEVDMSTVKERVAKVEESYSREEKRLKDWLKRDIQAWDKELDVSLQELKTDEEKEKLKAEYAAKKEVTRKKHQPGIEAIGPKKEAAIKEAKKKFEESQAEFKKAATKCVEDARKEGVSQKAAQCRIKATSKDQYWNLCK
ncbi:MAG: hypothetical protein GY854_05605 [Deltaproteobacteria bacterium]|nr:hypothetical protein [Deltaproteobacteria bacterium]